MSLRLFLSFGALVLLALAGSTPALAAPTVNILVNDLGDTPGACATNGTGTCTLRDAITYANANAGENAITFSVSGTITLGSPLPAINDTLTIDGTGKTITLDGANNYNILTVNSSETLNLTGLTLANASCDNLSCSGGAGIRNNGGTATVTHSTFTNNEAAVGSGGAIANLNNGTLTIINSTFSGNTAPGGSGGGIVNDSGTLTVSGSGFSDNSTYVYNYGGGILVNGGAATVSNSTFSNNATGYGGGIYVNAGVVNVLSSTFYNNEGRYGGGGIYNANGTLSVTNSTFTENYVTLGNGGALYNLNGTVYVVNSTIYNNSASQTTFDSGGIYNDGKAVKLRNTILANNSQWQCKDASSTLKANKYNLATDTTCGTATQITSAQLVLGPLQNNGGPTQTMALGAGSVALDAGKSAVCADTVGAPNYGAGGLDQRDVERPQGAICDIGAFESTQQFGPDFVVNDSADTDDGLCGFLAGGFSNCTLREALDAANARKGADNITFDIPAGTAGCTAANRCKITLTSLLPAINTNLTMDGFANNGRITIDGSGVSQVLIVASNKTFNLNALNLIDGKCDCPDGGGIVNRAGATLNVTNSTFSVDSTGGGDGIGIHNYGTANVTNSTFAGGSGTGDFGGILNGEGATLNVTNSTIAGPDYGIYMFGGTAVLRNTIVAAKSRGDCVKGNGTLTANKYNLDTDGSCGKATSKTVQEIELGPLQDNNGPTLTIKPGKDSAALNAGDNGVCLAAVGAPNYGAGGFDQRGVPRPKNTICDVGSVEVRLK